MGRCVKPHLQSCRLQTGGYQMRTGAFTIRSGHMDGRKCTQPMLLSVHKMQMLQQGNRILEAGFIRSRSYKMKCRLGGIKIMKCFLICHSRHVYILYFPMQNLLNILPKTSSEVISPDISPNAKSASCKSILNNSPPNPSSNPCCTLMIAVRARDRAS